MKNYVQDGKTITFTPTVVVTSGGALLIGALLAVALANIPANTPGEFITEGVVELPKANTAAIGQGDGVYWDDTAKVITATATDNTRVGKAWLGAGNPSTSVWVKINA